MTGYYLNCSLFQGYIHNWLVAGPQAIPLAELDHLAAGVLEVQIAQAHYSPAVDITHQPRQLAEFAVGEATLSWQYDRCQADHFIHRSDFYPAAHHLWSWAYAQIVCQTAKTTTVSLTTNGPADVWLNGQHIHRQTHFQQPIPRSVTFPIVLQKGPNDLLIRFEQVAIGGCAHRLACQFPGLPDDEKQVRVRLPLASGRIERFKAFERLFDQAALDRDIFAGTAEVGLHWPHTLPHTHKFLLRLQQPSGRIYAETLGQPKPNGMTKTVAAASLMTAPYQAILMPQPREYVQGRLRLGRTFPLHVLNRAPAPKPDKPYLERLAEGVQEALRQRQGLLTEIAAMTLGTWNYLNREVLKQSIEAINRREVGSVRNVLGLLGALDYYEDHESFPAGLKPLIETALLNFDDGFDETGNMGRRGYETIDTLSESGQILCHTARILAGQRYPGHISGSASGSGSEARRQAEVRAIDWLYRRGQYGFRAVCLDDDSLDEIIFALSHLAALAESTLIRELAAILLDKLCFTLAINSFQGVSLGGLLGPTASLARLMWGAGVFNRHLWGVVGLADSGYEMPPLIAGIALNPLEGEWSREHHAAPDGAWSFDRVTYRTPNYMLSSLQDYAPGEPGGGEKVWQAILSPEAVVFVNHPAHYGQQAVDIPNFWRGNRTLPRVAQWKDALIAIYHLPGDDWLGFSHAYFPLYAFDEYHLQDNWAFARRGEAYLALTASTPLQLMTGGLAARRELRAPGPKTIWLCQMGRAAQDGAFEEFQAKVLAAPVAFAGLAVRWTTLRHETLAFDWEGPLFVDDAAQPITGFKHYETPYCTVDAPAREMDIQVGEYLLKLDFSR
jgi:hypothetical protein